MGVFVGVLWRCFGDWAGLPLRAGEDEEENDEADDEEVDDNDDEEACMAAWSRAGTRNDTR